jgi:hypothetical protein
MPIASFFALDGDEDTVAILDFSEGAFDKGQVLLFKVCQIGNYYVILYITQITIDSSGPEGRECSQHHKGWLFPRLAV